jgi:SPP1 family holin
MENMTIKADTIARTIVLFLALANQVMVAIGWSPIELEEESVYVLVSTVATIVTAIWAWWKNNSFTKAAIKADKVLEEEKANGTGHTIS